MKNKLTTSILLFLILIPFRLPVSILFIYFFQWVIGVTTNEVIPQGILATNVIVSKVVYNVAIASWFLYTIEIYSREKFGRKATHEDYLERAIESPVYWWVVPIGILLLAFVIIDGISVYEIFFLSKR